MAELLALITSMYLPDLCSQETLMSIWYFPEFINRLSLRMGFHLCIFGFLDEQKNPR